MNNLPRIVTDRTDRNGDSVNSRDEGLFDFRSGRFRSPHGIP
jgi:hypothetical protein